MFGEGSSAGRVLVASVVIATLVFIAQLPIETTPPEGLPTRSDDPADGINNAQYVNFTNPSWNWTSWFYNISFPQGSWAKIELTLTQINHGDPWDRANVVGVNNVIIMEMTTKENATVLVNPVQTYTKDVTVYTDLFNESAAVYWSGMPNYQGGWNCSLSFAFYPGTPPIVLPEVMPAIFYRTLSASNTTSVNVTFPQGVTRAKAVLIEEGHSDEEFWFANVPPTVRDFTLDINGTRVFDITAFPFMNSGACLNAPNCWTLYEWNGTPPPGTGLRPQFEIDVSPYVSLLNGTQPIVFGIGNGAGYWKISLAFFVWRNPRLTPYTLDDASFHRTATSSEQYLESNSTAHRPVMNGMESIEVRYKAWLNASFPDITAHSIATVSRMISSPTVTYSTLEREEVFHNITRDASTAADVLYIIKHENISSSSGNGQDFSRTDYNSSYYFIDGDNGGRASVGTRRWTDYSHGNYAPLGPAWDRKTVWWHNRTSSFGTGVDQPPNLFQDLSGAAHPFPAVLFTEPAFDSYIAEPMMIFTFLYTDHNIVNATLTVYNSTYDVTGAPSFAWNTTVAYGPYFLANVTATNVIEVTSHNVLPLRGTKWHFTEDFVAGDVGWHFISIPIPLADSSVENVLVSIAGRYDALRYYDASDPLDRWKAYHVSKSYGELTNIDTSMGFWINITAPANLDIVGPLPNVTSILLRKGWNMIGFPSLVEDYTIGDFMADTGAMEVEGWADAPPYYLADLPGSHVMAQGEGYWVRMPANFDWNVPTL